MYTTGLVIYHQREISIVQMMVTITAIFGKLFYSPILNMSTMVSNKLDNHFARYDDDNEFIRLHIQNIQ